MTCSQTEEAILNLAEIKPEPKMEYVHVSPHNYGGWYCPDNLRGFPAEDIADWNNVPVVNGRMPTEAETRDGRSLMSRSLPALLNGHHDDPRSNPRTRTVHTASN